MKGSMKTTSFERVERQHGNKKIEQVEIRRKSRHSHFGLKLLSLLLAALLWLILVNVHDARTEDAEPAEPAESAAALADTDRC